MLVIDGPHNGWRHLVLPIAYSDTLVMDAVLTVSAFHHASDAFLSYEEQDTAPNKLYSRTILGLQQRSSIANCDRTSQHAIVLTILLLLTASMISCCTDFPILFGMLKSAVDAIGGGEQLGSGEVAEFITRQIHK